MCAVAGRVWGVGHLVEDLAVRVDSAGGGVGDVPAHGLCQGATLLPRHQPGLIEERLGFRAGVSFPAHKDISQSRLTLYAWRMGALVGYLGADVVACRRRMLGYEAHVVSRR